MSTFAIQQYPSERALWLNAINSRDLLNQSHIKSVEMQTSLLSFILN